MRRRCGESQPSLHWKGLLFIARASRIYWPRPRARPRGHGELLKLLRFAEEKKTGMERSGQTSTAFRRAGWPGGSGTGGAPVAARNASESAVGLQHTTFACLLMPVYMWPQNVHQLDVSFLTHSRWQAAAGVAGKEETAQSALAAAQLEAWLSLDRPARGHAAAAGSNSG